MNRFLSLSLALGLCCLFPLSAQARGKKTSAEPTEATNYQSYSLAEFGRSPDWCDWVVQIIPEVVEPDSWKKKGAQAPVLVYNSSTKFLLVRQTTTGHREIEKLLASLKTQPGAQTKVQSPTLQQASFQILPLPTPAQVAFPASTAVPALPAGKSLHSNAPTQQPKHLFHLIVEGFKQTEKEGLELKNFTFRYEGDGLIDDTVAKVLMAQSQQSATKSDKEGSGESKKSTESQEAILSLMQGLFGAGFSRTAMALPSKEMEQPMAPANAGSANKAEPLPPLPPPSSLVPSLPKSLGR